MQPFLWTRDPLHTSNGNFDSVLEFPDYQVSFGEHSYVLGEFKLVVALSKDMRKDYKKMVIMGKRVVDGLFQDGFSSPVILIHGQGMEIDIYSICLHSEALYKLTTLGKFRLVSSPYEFGLLLGLGPLISAQVIYQMSDMNCIDAHPMLIFTFSCDVLGDGGFLVQSS